MYLLKLSDFHTCIKILLVFNLQRDIIIQKKVNNVIQMTAINKL